MLAKYNSIITKIALPQINSTHCTYHCILINFIAGQATANIFYGNFTTCECETGE